MSPSPLRRGVRGEVDPKGPRGMVNRLRG